MEATLTVWKFPTDTGADTAHVTLKDLAKQELIKVHDGAIVSWPEGARKPKTRQFTNLVGVGALGGVFWGLLFGVLFFLPLLGAAVGAGVVGAGVGAVAGALSDIGIDDDFIADVREKVTPGTSAMFVLTSGAVLDRVHEEFVGQLGELVSTNLSHEQERQLRELFGV
ncbi:MAG: DUF1269 domain-containing protein [Comamonadaceae bacterium]|nr:MAG: DUF1269 domain-containing protein [Comamonadaceae bacterium]